MAEAPPGSARVSQALAELDAVDLTGALRLRGSVVRVSDGVADVVGLPDVAAEELVVFDGGACGMAYDVAPEHTGVILLAGADQVSAGQGVTATGTLPSLPAAPELLGRMIDPLGQPLDDLPAPVGQSRPIFHEAPALIERASVDRPLHTGVLAIDAAIPIGRGQRQLILGDRNVGKTALALDIVAAQRDSGVVCVYVVVGQPLSRVLAIREALRDSGALAHTVVVAAEAAETPAMQYLAPYAGTTIAECFRDGGRDALVVHDDLTKHADAYRELALLLGRPPGREAFPGDIFYIHGELLERATAFNDEHGGGSVTAFPIVETTDNDISTYIPTNLISITDGQIYLDTVRFERNYRPAIDIGMSVSRIGGVAQPDSLRAASKNLRIQVARFESLETITRVGLDVDPRTARALRKGRILRELLQQHRFQQRTVADEAIALTITSQGWVDDLQPKAAREVVWRTAELASEREPELVASLEAGTPLNDAAVQSLKAVFDEAAAEVKETAP
ncbi:MAG: F0F1 ATP synthase subunit alpha [Myxococcales bacterium]|jgi:F-type H+-transporting ATPase subunit alpha